MRIFVPHAGITNSSSTHTDSVEQFLDVLFIKTFVFLKHLVSRLFVQQNYVCNRAYHPRVQAGSQCLVSDVFVITSFPRSHTQFSSVQDGIRVLGKAHVGRSFPSIALETDPAFVRLMMALSHPFKEDR